MFRLLATCTLWYLTLLSENVSTTTDASIVEPKVEDAMNVKYLACQNDVITEKEYVIFNNGSILLPQNHKIYPHHSYVIDNETAYICISSEDEETIVESTEVYNFTEEFLKCAKILIEPDEYELMENQTLYISSYKKSYSPRDYYLQDQEAYVCIPNFDEMIANSSDPSIIAQDTSKFSVIFGYISLAGLTISIISLILHLVVFCCVASARNLPGYCLASLSVTLLSAYLCFIITSFITSTEQCAHLGVCIYYFFLTSFFWMNVIAFDVWRSFRVVIRELRISSHRVPWRRFLLYSIYSWLIPAGLAIFAVISDSTDILPESYRPDFGHRICWFGQRKGLLVFFAAPLCVVMVLNLIFFLDCAYVINRATIKTSQVDKVMLTRRFFMFMRLALLMGLTWAIGIVAGYADQVVLWYIFVVLNTLQGLFIFIVFSCSSKVRIAFIIKLRGGENKRQSTSVRTISQASIL